MRRTWFVLVLALNAGLALCLVRSLNSFPYDFSINWTAAWRFRLGGSLYDQNALRILGSAYIGPIMERFFDITYESFIGIPTTPLIYLPFTLLPFTYSVVVYRAFALGCLGIAVYHTATESDSPTFALLCGLFCVILWQPLQLSIDLGQLDGLIVLCIALAITASRRGWWKRVGVLAGVATMIKVSPGLIVIGMTRRSHKVVVGALLLGVSLLLVLVVLNRLSDVVQFVTTTAPALSRSTNYIENISLGASIARIAEGGEGSSLSTTPLGYWRLIALGLVGVYIAQRWWRPLRYAHWSVCECVILALLAGPITWDHYIVWSIPVFQLLAARFQGPLRSVVFILAAVCALPTLYIESFVWYHAIKTFALLGVLVLVTLADSPNSAQTREVA